MIWVLVYLTDLISVNLLAFLLAGSVLSRVVFPNSIVDLGVFYWCFLLTSIYLVISSTMPSSIVTFMSITCSSSIEF